MGFADSFKRLFGFASDIEEIDENENFSDDTEREPYINPFKKQSSAPVVEAAVQPVAANHDDAPLSLPKDAIEQIASLINEGLPDSVKSYIDKEAQSKYIADSINSRLAGFIKQIHDNAVVEEAAQFAKYKTEAESKIASLTSELAEANAKCKESADKYLSADRQRKTMSEKMHELEAKVLKCEADVEQFQLENKSLLNKLKVMQVKTEDVQFFKDENARQSVEIEKLKKESATVKERRKQYEDEIEALRNRAEKAEQKLSVSDESESRIDGLQARIDELTALAEAKDKEIDAHGVELAEAKEKLRLANEELESLREQNAVLIEEQSENQADMTEFEEMQNRLDKFEDVKRRKDERINTLTSDLFKRDEVIKKLNAEVAELHKTIENNRNEYSLKIKEISKMYEAQLVVKKEHEKQQEVSFDMTDLEPIDDFPLLDTVEPVRAISEPTTDPVPETKQTVISAIDDDDSYWLMPSPPTMPKATEDEETEQAAPQSASQQDNSRQLSLF